MAKPGKIVIKWDRRPEKDVELLTAIIANPQYRQTLFPTAMAKPLNQWIVERDLAMKVLASEDLWLLYMQSESKVEKGDSEWTATDQWTSKFSGPIKSRLEGLRKKWKTGYFVKLGIDPTWSSQGDIPRKTRGMAFSFQTVFELTTSEAPFMQQHPYYFLLRALVMPMYPNPAVLPDVAMPRQHDKTARISPPPPPSPSLTPMRSLGPAALPNIRGRSPATMSESSTSDSDSSTSESNSDEEAGGNVPMEIVARPITTDATKPAKRPRSPSTVSSNSKPESSSSGDDDVQYLETVTRHPVYGHQLHGNKGEGIKKEPHDAKPGLARKKPRLSSLSHDFSVRTEPLDPPTTAEQSLESKRIVKNNLKPPPSKTAAKPPADPSQSVQNTVRQSAAPKNASGMKFE
ncbi:hypothetical protein P7C73_g5592, partial [Tremellales sp. Uapishka_1]